MSDSATMQESTQESRAHESGIDLDLLLPFQIAQLHSKLNGQARAILARHGTLTLPQWRILRVLGMGVANTSTGVRKATGIDKGHFSKTLDALVAQGLVVVSPSDHDRRQFDIALTEKGWAAHDRIVPDLNARNEHLLSALTRVERKVIFAAIRAVAKAADKIDFGSADGQGYPTEK